MESFIYDIPVRIYFGPDQLTHLGEELGRFGNKVLLTYGGGSIKKSGLYDRVTDEIKKAGLELVELPGIEPNPRVGSVRKGAALCREHGVDVLLAVGGGSTIDCTKFIGAAALYDGDAWDISTRKFKPKECLPIVTVLTLSATGSEMDDGGVITNPGTTEKIGMSYPCMLPKVSFLDPTLTYSVPKFQTACGAADILSHTLEVYFNTEPRMYLLDCAAEGVLKTVIRYAPIALAQPDSYEARANLMWASSWAINGFLTGGEDIAWSCHPMEHELSAFYDITHGLGLAILTPRWMRYTLNEQTAPCFVRFARNVFGVPDGDPMETAREGIDRLSEFLFETLGLASTLTELGIDDKNFRAMAEKACRGRVIRGFQPLTADDIEKIYRMCL